MKKVTTINSQMPSKQEYDEFMDGPFTNAVKLKQTLKVANIMQVAESIRKRAPWNAPGYVEEGVDPTDTAAAVSAQNAKAVNGISNIAMTTPAALEMVASSMDSIISSTYGSPESSLNLDSDTSSASIRVVGDMLNGAEDADLSTPEDMTVSFTTVNNVIGANIGASALIAEDTECKAVPPADLKKSPKMEYDPRITDYSKPVDNTDILKQQACNVRDHSMGASEENAKKFDGMGEKMKFLALQKMVLGETQEIRSASGVVMKNQIMKNMTAAVLGIGDSGSNVQTGENFCPTGNCDDPVGTSMAEYPKNTKSGAAGADALGKDTKVVSMEVTLGDGSENVAVANLSEPLVITIKKPAMNMSSEPNCTNCNPGPSGIDPSVALKGKIVPLIYSQFNIPRPDSTFNVEMYLPTTEPHRLFVMVSIGKQPTLKNHDLFKMVEDFPKITEAPSEVDAVTKYDWFVGVEHVNNRTGRVFVAVGELKEELDLEAIKQKLDTNETIDDVRSKDLLVKNFSTPYLIRTFTSGCFYFDNDLNRWTSYGLTCVGADAETISCATTHLSTFASGLVVEPNTIDFAYVFANASFTDNLTIYMTMIVSLGLYLILVIWSRYQDKKDVEKVGARPMPDNVESDKYLYEVMVYTGHKSDAATDSVVSMVLVGDKDETCPRTFGKPKRKFFRKGGQDAFVMACPRPLGDLLHLRVWHDNSGVGRYSSWYLQYIHIRDVQTGKHYDFVADRWLAVEENDGKIDALIPVAGKEQLGQFSHVFSHTSQQNLSDGHLWFSVFLRPPRSRFTRVQRVSSCFALLFLSMMVNAMWYGVVPSTPSSGALNFGPMSLSIEQISVGVMSNLIIFPPSFLIVFLFKKSRARKLRKSRIDEALEKQKFGNQVAKSERPASVASHGEKSDEGNDKKKKKKKKPLLLPWWCRIIAWILCIICLFGSAFIVWAYGVQFGNEKTTKWLTSLLTSFFSSILLIQPIKVFLIAMVVSSIFKSVDLESDDADEDERQPTLAADEEWIHSKPKKRRSKYNGAPDIYDQETLGKMRRNRLDEVQMWRIIREIVSYGFFLYILIILSFDNRDPNSFYLRANLEAAFIKEGDLTNGKPDLDFTRVHDAGTFWTWAQNVVMQELRAQNWYDFVSPPYGLKGFLDDRVNRIMGYGMIRQIRSKPNTCRIHGKFADSFENCAGLSGLFDEENRHFCTNWTLTGSRKDCNRNEYRYMTATDLDGLPYIGSLDVYGGGGYVYPLTGRMGTIAKKMQQLREEAWIDHMTRAVMVEFSVYNSQVNLFGIATIFAEAVPGGGFLPGWRFDGVRLIRHHAGFQTFVFICEITYMFFIIYFMVREIRDMIKQKKDYFKSYWVYSEIAIILLSWAAFIVYILRYIETDAVLKIFKDTYGNGYVKMQYAQTLDDVFGYLLGMLVFIATIKFSKLLRFNRRIGMLSATLKQCWGDLTGFFLIFFIALGTFAMVFHLLLLTHMDDFKNIMSATESEFAMMLNKFDFESMRAASLLAVVLFLMFAITMSIFFVNVLLTIIIRAFQQVKDDVLNQPNDFEILEFVQMRMFRFIGLGQHRVQPLREHVKQFQEEQQRKDKQQKQIDQLPSKMDQFLSQVNDMYFDGQLDLNNKEFLKKTLASKKNK
ncbi:polycystic kidney disease protein 1-like 2 [Amphibalanus amphitrite]|uniref:polycystic kidney disease protein 1-like 2 n=1 Tax=Amphibalanus amphitrite TaxID=1232801 RepID=UPI001C913C69|nr:polycystic kidney disease protein 1-like 2 [Amphibalanus amphitrite]